MTVSTVIEDTADTRLGRAIEPRAAAHPQLSGIYPLPDARGALAARLLLADAAERSLDVQYYIWNGDSAGTLMMDALVRAADRGVRVRLLLDDNGIGGLDATLAAVNAHANIQVRIVNPFPNRSAHWLGFLTDFSRLNRRMHNKSFTADNQVSIVGGRNIGDEYFAAGPERAFVDLDVITVGTVVGRISQSFDLYWNSGSAYPAASLLKARASAPDQVAAAAAAVRADPEGRAYLQSLQSTRVVRDLLQGSLPFEWARTRLVCDDPAKLLGQATGSDSLVYEQLERIVGKPQREFVLVSPYFVPEADGTQSLVAMAGRGVQVSVLTNSLAATDVIAVHAGYAKRRKALLRGGVRLFELKATPMDEARTGGAGIGGSSGASLHAKTFAVDGEHLFVGSFNFDPRSAELNTEMGLVIDSPALAQHMTTTFHELVATNAYQVRLDKGGDLEWVADGPEGRVRTSSEPDASFMRRMTAGIAGWLPIEGLL